MEVLTPHDIDINSSSIILVGLTGRRETRMSLLSSIGVENSGFSGLKEKTKGRRVVVALSSGGLRIVCHLPLLRILENLEIKVDELWGVSAGSIAGGLWASGRSSLEIEEYILNVKKHEIYDNYLIPGLRALLPSKNGETVGILSGKKLVKYLRKLIGNEINPLLNLKDFRVLAFNRGLNCRAVMRVGTEPGTIEITQEIDGRLSIERGFLVDMLRASFATPVMFKPVRLNGHYYVDGGITENYPVLTALEHYRKDLEAGRETRGMIVIGVNIGYSGEFVDQPTNLIKSIAESYDIIGCELSRLQIGLFNEKVKTLNLDCELITIDPGVNDLALTDFKRLPEALAKAVDSTVQKLSSI